MAIATSQPAAWHGLSTDPLAANIEALIVGGLGKTNLITSAALTEIGTVTSTVVSGENCYNVSSASALRCAALTDFGSGPLTMFAVCTVNGATGGYFVTVGASGGSDNWHAINSGGNAAPNVNSRGSSSAAATAGASIRFSRAILGATITNSAARKIYVNGTPTADTTTCTVSGADTPVVGGLYRGGSVGNFTDGTDVAMVGWVRGAWSDADWTSFAANPWRVLDDGVTAPTLTTPTTTSITATTATIGATTNTASGTLYCVVTTSATPPSAAQVKAGQNNGGTAAVFAANQAVSSTGAKTSAATGLSAATTYYHYWVHNAAGADSAVLSSASFTTSSAAATAVTMTGPTAGTVSVASSNFTVGANGSITGTVTVTPSDSSGGGSFTPTSVNISSGTPTATFTYTAGSAGTKTISVTNGGGLPNPSNISYVATAGVPYTTADITEPVAGQPTSILIPNSYSAGTPTDLVIYCHGRGESQTSIYSTSDNKAGTINAITGAGIFVACSAATVAGIGASAWGCPGAVEAIVQLERYMRATYNIRRVVLWGDSMGGITALNAIISGRIDVHGFLGHAPVCSLADMQVGAYGGEIDAAYGVGASPATYANKSRGYDPCLRPGFSWRHIPMLMAASPADGAVNKTNNADALAAIVAGSCREAVVYAATGGHIDVSHYDASRDLAFIQRCLNTPVALGRPSATKTVSITLTSDGTTPRASMTGLKWSWWDQLTPDVGEYPTDKGAGETTDGSGVLTITVHSQLSAGGIGWLVVTDSDGTTTQSPAAKAFSGPVAVA